MKSWIVVFAVLAALSSTGCGGVGMKSTPPPPSNFTISVTVTGLSGTLGLQDNLGDQLTFTSDSTQTFATQYASGAGYAVNVVTPPAGETCIASSNSTGIITANVTVTVTCTTSGTFHISAAVTGLSGGTLVLEDNLGDQLSFTTNTTQMFATAYQSGQPYTVLGVTQPAGQSCTLGSNASGNITGDVTVAVTCAPIGATFSISAAVTGLASGGTLILQASSTDQLTFTSNTTKTFLTQYASGTVYAVTVLTQPTGQTCTLSSNATGTITSNITVTATCTTNTANDTISVAVTGLTGTLVVQDDKHDTLTFTTNNTQTFATSYASGSTYSVTVKTQPTGQTCTLSSNSSGTITSNITVTATCTTNPVNFTISVKVTGLTGTLVVQDDKSDTLTFTTNSTQTFAMSYASGSTYSVTVQTQPSGQTCTLSGNATGTITSNITVTATCGSSGGNPTISATVAGLSGTLELQDDKGDTLTFTTSGTQTFATSYTSGSTYVVDATIQPSVQTCTPTMESGTITSNLTITFNCGTAPRQLGSVSGVSTIACPAGAIKNGVCQQMTVSCPDVPDLFAYVKTNTPTGASLGTVTYNVGTDGNGLYESLFTFGSTAVGNVLDAGFTTVQISWGGPFNTNQLGGWVTGPGGVLAAACRYATVTQWIYNNIQKNNSLPMCATGNSGGAGALGYALSQYGSGSVLSMAEVTSGPMTARLDWGCGCLEGSKTAPVPCGSSSSLGTCFGAADSPVWDPAYTPKAYCSQAAVNKILPPGGLNFFFDDSAEAPGVSYNYPKTHVNVLFGGADKSAAIPIAMDWYNNITSSKTQGCVVKGQHSIANDLIGAQQIANDLIGMCKLQ